jgi:hypothetical protein
MAQGILLTTSISLAFLALIARSNVLSKMQLYLKEYSWTVLADPENEAGLVQLTDLEEQTGAKEQTGPEEAVRLLMRIKI